MGIIDWYIGLVQQLAKHITLTQAMFQIKYSTFLYFLCDTSTLLFHFQWSNSKMTDRIFALGITAASSDVFVRDIANSPTPKYSIIGLVLIAHTFFQVNPYTLFSCRLKGMIYQSNRMLLIYF